MREAVTHEDRGQEHARSTTDWRRKASDHIAFSLLVYTGLHIFMTVGALKGAGGSLMPYFALVVLVVAIVPACRWLEMRWQTLADDHGNDPALKGQFFREMALLWLGAIGLPVLLTLAFTAIAGMG